MATYFVKGSGGSDANNGTTWALAKATVQAGLNLLSASGGDTLVVKYDDVHSLSADTTFTTPGSCSIIAASANDTATAFTPTPMGETGYIGHASTSYAIAFNGGADDKVYMYGLTFRVSGSTSKNITIAGNNVGLDVAAEECKFWLSGTGGGTIALGTDGGRCSRLHKCEFKFGHNSQTIQPSNCADTSPHLTECSFTGTAPTTLIATNALGKCVMSGCDLSAMSGTLVGNLAAAFLLVLERCRLHSSTTLMAAQTSNPTDVSGKVMMLDCNSGDTHGLFGYYDAYGSVVSDTTIKVTAGAAGQSWKITTTSAASFSHPFRTPWIELYNSGTSAITPSIEIMRHENSAAAYKDSEDWSEWLVKTDSGFTQARGYDDRQAVSAWAAGTAGANQDTGALGAAGWVGETASSPWYGKLSPGSVTPDEVGAISARVCVGVASISGTLYVDPQIRT